MSLLSIAFSLFLLMDSIGNIPLYIAILKDIDAKRQRVIILRELTIALGAIVMFSFAGTGLMEFLHIEQDSLQIAGGIILFLLCLKMIFPPPEPAVRPNLVQEPFIVPLAIPLVAGPGVLAAVMIFTRQEADPWVMLGAILIAWFFSLLILLSASFLKQILGSRVITAMERLMGLILILIATEMFLSGAASFIQRTHVSL